MRNIYLILVLGIGGLLFNSTFVYTQTLDTTYYFNKTYQDTFGLSYAVVPLNSGYLIGGHRTLPADSLVNIAEKRKTIYLHKTDKKGNTIWLKDLDTTTYGTQGNYYAFFTGNCILQEKDNLVLLYGNFGENRYTKMVKTDTSCNLIWEKTYNILDFSATNFIKTKDLGYIISGHTGIYDGIVNALLLKTDSLGNMEWYKTYAIDSYQIAFSVLEIPEAGGYVLGGYVTKNLSSQFADSSDMFLLRTDIAGNLLWQQRFGSPNDADCAVLTLPYDQNTYWGVGCSYDKYTTGNDLYIAHYNYNGDTIWTKKYHKPPVIAYGNSISSIISTPSKGIIGLGHGTNMAYGNQMPFIVEYDSLGNELWFEYIDPSYENTRYLMDIESTPDGGYVMSGFQNSYPQYSWLLKMDGAHQTCSYLGCDSLFVPFTVWHNFSDSLTLWLGDSIMLQSNAGGGTAPYTYEWLLGSGLPYLSSSEGASVQFNADSVGFFSLLQLIKDSAGNSSTQALYITVKDTLTASLNETVAPLWWQGRLSIAPNPATDKLFIHSPEALTNVEIYNTLCQLQHSQNFPPQQEGLREVSVAHLTSGIYLLRAYTKSGKVITQKFMKR